MENLNEDYKQIKGWGMDADPDNEPTYPMKLYTGDDHNRLNWERPELQPQRVEVYHSNERPNLSAVYGTTCPPSGLSGLVRRFAFKYSEGDMRHWFTLIFADRINVVEGIIDDLKHGHVPNVFAERGWKGYWKHDKKGLIKKVAVGTAVTAGIMFLLFSKKKAKPVW